MEIIKTIKLDDRELTILKNASVIFDEICGAFDCAECPLHQLCDDNHSPNWVIDNAINALSKQVADW